jgi:hypothetical protein
MVAINFQTEFSDDIESGKKCQTIRQKARCKPGDKLQLYTGQRTKKCRKLMDAICTEVHKIVMPLRDNKCISDAFARADGFESSAAMQEWFHNRYKTWIFEGFLIKWKPN